MSPPQLIGNTGQYGEFVLVQKNPAMGEDSVMDDWSHYAVTWGLYSEAIMMEHLPLERQLFTLLARLQRAGRMFMDPMVNLGLLSPG